MEAGSRGRKAVYIIGITAGVYLTFRFLLPLVIPFLIAYLGAGLMAPMVHFLQHKLHFNRGFATVIVGLLFFLFLGTAGLWLVHKLAEEAGRFIGNRSNSLPIVKALFEGIAVIFITLISMLMICKDYEALQERRERMLFAEEIDGMAKKVSSAMGAYIKTQGILMLITAVICVIGLFILKNPYALLLGLTIAVLDALPFIGTGIIFIPWAVLVGVMGDWKLCIGLLVIYGACYLVRELLEPKLMGKQIGMTSLEMIISMYIGIRLFGLAGVILGPVGYLLIVELFHTCCSHAAIL